MSYGRNPCQRLDKLETRVCEAQITCMEVGNEAEREFNYELSERMSDRYDQLALRLERLAHIGARLSAIHDYTH